MSRLSFIFLIIFLTQSCGIYTFTGADIHPNIKTVSVTYFKNQATLIEPTLSQKFTDALQDRFLQQTSLNLIQKNGDIHFEGYISNYQVKPVGISSNDQANQNRLTITVFVRFNNQIENEKSYEQSFNRFADFDSSLNLADIEETLIDEIIIELVEDVFNKAVVNW